MTTTTAYPKTAGAVPPRLAPRPGQLGQLMRSFDRSLRAQGRATSTRDQYLMSVGQMVDYFATTGMPDRPDLVTREHVETFLAEFAQSHKPSTVQTRYKCLRLFFAFLREEGEVRKDPMANMKPPIVPDIPVLTDDQLTKLLKACSAKDFDSRRDIAIIRLFMDTGIRRGAGGPEGRGPRLRARRGPCPGKGPPAPGVPIRSQDGPGH